MPEATEGCNIYHPLEFPCNSRQFTNETPCTETLSFHAVLLRQELARTSFLCSKGYPVTFSSVWSLPKQKPHSAMKLQRDSGDPLSPIYHLRIQKGYLLPTTKALGRLVIAAVPYESYYDHR